MAHLHDLATTIANFWQIAVLSALAAGLVVIALMNGSARVRRSALPNKFPADADAQLDKYLVSFNQLDQVAQNNPGNVTNLVEQLKSQPGPHLCLKAFESFVSTSARSAKPVKPPRAEKAARAPKESKSPKSAKEPKAAAAEKAGARAPMQPSAQAYGIPRQAAPGGDYDYDDDDFPATVEVALPKSIQDERRGQ